MERLPVNPRRHKIPPEARKRVAQACNSCNVRRAKCSGGRPCDRCRRSSRECQYPEVEETVSVSRREYDALKARVAHLEQSVSDSSPWPRDRENSSHSLQDPLYRTWSESHDAERDLADDSHHFREGRILQDPDGNVRYLGESSGATFLNHLREYMATVFPLAFEAAWPRASNPDTTAFISALGRYQTHDSRPLLTTSVDPLIRPSREQAAIMLSELRYSAQDGEGTYPSGGIYYWIDALALQDQYHAHLDTHSPMEVGPAQVTTNAAFAVACQFDPACGPSWESGLGQTFFARAKNMVGNPLDVSMINDATVLALLGFYLLNNNRRDAAYIYVSVAMHILMVHGVHRAWMVDEQGKRLFWTVYVLDRWLSCLMGRPPLVSDDSIKLDLPRDARGLPPAAGLRAHVELARVSNYIVCNVYDVARQTGEPVRTTLCIQKSLAWLKAWGERLPPTVQASDENLSCDRAVGELHMCHNQLVILSVRPLLFINVKKATADMLVNGRTGGHELSHKAELDLCADAARRNIYLWHRLLNLPRPVRLSHTSVHYLFNAALTLQLCQILVDGQVQGDYDDIGFVISTLGVDDSSNKDYAKDCAHVLSDLGSLILRLRTLDLPKPVARGDEGRPLALGLPMHSPVLSSPSDRTPGTASTSDSQPFFRHGAPTAEESAPRRHGGPASEDRELAYNELLSWLEGDNLQRRVDFPRRFG